LIAARSTRSLLNGLRLVRVLDCLAMALDMLTAYV
jgi:hypothetical protein